MKHKFQQACMALAIAGLLASCGTQVEAPKSYGPLPTADQLAWQHLEYYMFVHFGPNTFTDVEWGDGKEDPKVFNPTDLDCRQWAATAKAAGMKGIIITAKHHDGFCLWPSQYSTHTVRESLWKDGKGDLLRELSDACKEYGLKFGVYLSPWDQNHPDYGTPAYNQVFANTLTEVLSSYGEVFEQWFDGANGEGEGGKRQVYDWPLFHQTVFNNQPQAIIFSDIGPGCRWVGNEAGHVGATNWSRLDTAGFGPGRDAPNPKILNTGQPDGKAWVPGETNTSIRPGWFYSPSTDDRVKSLQKLVGIYYTSVGRNSNMLLNVPPDRRGRIHPNDSTRLMELRRVIDESFRTNLLAGTTATASTTRGNAAAYAASNLLDGNYDTYWCTDDNVTTATLEIDLKEEKAFNCIWLQEYIALGQRVARFNVEYWDSSDNAWKQAAEETTIGYKRLVRFPTVTSAKLRVNILESLACPLLNNIELYFTPEEFLQAGDDQKAAKFTTKDKKESILMDLGETASVKGFYYIPVNNVAAPNIARYNCYVSNDSSQWKQVVTNGIFNNIKNNPIRQDVTFDKAVQARYIRLEAVELANEGDKYTVVETGAIR